MRVTAKVTIPQNIREKLGVFPSVEVDFVEEKGRVFLVKRKEKTAKIQIFKKVRGVATVKMTTD